MEVLAFVFLILVALLLLVLAVAQHVMAGRDAAIAVALDELVQAASALAEDQAAVRSGTRVARGRPRGSRATDR